MYGVVLSCIKRKIFVLWGIGIGNKNLLMKLLVDGWFGYEELCKYVYGVV